MKDSAFLFSGFNNWKDATVGFASHVTHRRDVEAVITIPQTTRNVGEMLSSAHAEEQCKSRQCLLTIAHNIRFLARQGIALRGDGKEDDSNFTQLLHLRAVDQPQLLPWLKRKTDKYTIPQIQNELLKVMATTVLRTISQSIQICKIRSRLLCASGVWMNISNPIKMYEADCIKSNTIVEILKDTMIRLNLAVSDCRGQCYDGAANMAGIRNGVATQIRAEEPRAIYSHCYGHALNLAACDTVKKKKILRDVLDSIFEISKLLKYSPKCSTLFAKLKQDIAAGTPGFRTLCPTRWTVRGNSLKSVIDNYLMFQVPWEEVKEETRDVEIWARVIGVEATMNIFFGGGG